MIEDISNEESYNESYTDPIADRVHAMAAFVTALDRIKNDVIRREGLEMMRVVRRSIRTQPQGDLIQIKGGKSE